MRDPAIHVKMSALKEILSNYGITDKTVLDILVELNPHQIRDRAVIETRTARRKRTLKILDVPKADTKLFNRLLTLVRKEKGHHFSTIKDSGKEWALFCDVVKEANNFCDSFKIARDLGYVEFIRIGIKLMGRKYSLNKFKSYAQRILDYYVYVLAIREDDSPEATEDFYNAYCAVLIKYTGIDLDIDNVEDYVNMVYAKQACDECGAKYDDWVEAQFDGLSFTGGVPEFNQLYGENAVKRYRAFMAKSAVKAKKSGVNFKSGAEEDYWKSLK